MTAGTPIQGGSDAYEQCKAVLTKIKILLEAAGSSMSDVVKMTVYVTDIAVRPAFARARGEFWRDPMPCSTFIIVKGLVDPGWVIEVDVTSIRGASKA